MLFTNVYGVAITRNGIIPEDLCLVKYPVKRGLPEVSRLGTKEEMLQVRDSFQVNEKRQRMGFEYALVPVPIVLDPLRAQLYRHLNRRDLRGGNFTEMDEAVYRFLSNTVDCEVVE